MERSPEPVPGKVRRGEKIDYAGNNFSGRNG